MFGQACDIEREGASNGISPNRRPISGRLFEFRLGLFKTVAQKLKLKSRRRFLRLFFLWEILFVCTCIYSRPHKKNTRDDNA